MTGLLGARSRPHCDGSTEPAAELQRRWFAALFCLSLITRLLMLSVTGPVVADDSPHYLGVARNLLVHGSLSEHDEFTGELRPQTLRTPGYPLFVAAFYATFERTETAHRAIAIAQVLLASLVAPLVAGLGFKRFSTRTGLAAGLLSAFDPWLSYASLSLLADSLFSLLYLLYFALGAWTLNRPRAGSAVLWAALLGLCVGVKPVAEWQIAIVAGLLLLTAVPLKRRLALAALALATFAAVDGGWRLRNRLQTGHWDLVTHKGRSLLWETAELTRPSTPEQRQADPRLARVRDIVARAPQEAAEIRNRKPASGPVHPGQVAYLALREEMGLSEGEADRLMAAIALENLRRQPLAYARRGIVESGLFLTRISMAVDLIWELSLVDAGVVESWREGRYLYPLANLALRIATAITCIPLLCLGLVQAWRTAPENRLLHLLFAATLAFHLLVAGLVVGDDRYRLPLHPMILLYSCAGAWWLADCVRRWAALRAGAESRAGSPI